MNRCFTIAGTVVLIACAMGCASSGKKIDRTGLSQIQNEAHTKRQITGLFGEPSYKRAYSDDFYPVQVVLPMTMLGPAEAIAAYGDIDDQVNGPREQWVYEYKPNKEAEDAGYREVLVVDFNRAGMVSGHKFEVKYAVTRQKVKKLKALTGAPALECRTVLSDMNGDMNKSVAEIHKRGLASATREY